MSRLPRFHPLTARLLAMLAALVLLAAQTLAVAHAAQGCEAAHHGHEAGIEHALGQAQGAGDDDDVDTAEPPCALCVFKAAASEGALPPPETTSALLRRPSARAPAADSKAWPAGRTPARAPARGPPTPPLRA